MSDFQESRCGFTLSLGGESSIDAELFSKIITDTVELVRLSATAISPNCFLRLEIKATRNGSFETIINAIVKCADSLLSKENARLAFEAVSGCLSFLKIKKHLRGEKPKSIHKKAYETTFINQNGSELDVPRAVADTLLYNNKIENSIINIFQCAEIAKRDNFCIHMECSDEPSIVVGKEEYKEMQGKIFDDESLLMDATFNIAYSIVSLAFKRDNKWRLSDGESVHTVMIKDDMFLEKVDKNIISFSKNDVLVCETRVRQWQTGANLKIEHEVVKVLDHKKSPVQQNLTYETS
jgi:hypothetical protein